ncbi:hypothetical protein EKO23_11960 [Nocardioides guangzhouensis]|uniref:Uncharacterized protein n=1 Tax=Nocardioides guangzhouensis TaxID=2497878 RepID=A0A4V1XZ69_9ACTN|nr:hypothetical protein [Nocardioides guangzhouensis]RYP85709.1 hypothetical protein EKO23_11960 [Nocardioides guangzhouensis]
MTGARPPAWLQRGIAVVVLLATGIVSLPAVAYALDGPTTENLVLPAQLVLMAGVGALVGFALPELTGTGSTPRRAVGIGVLLGLAAALVGVALLFLLLNGFPGA